MLWQVSHGVVQLAFSLLESGGGPKGETYANQRAVELAGLVLPLIIKRQPHLTQPVVTQLCNFILSSSSPAQYIGKHCLLFSSYCVVQHVLYVTFLNLHDSDTCNY